MGQIVVSGMPLVVRDVARSPLFAQWSELKTEDAAAVRSFVGVPIKGENRTIGTITIERVGSQSSPGTLDEDVRYLTMIANLVGQTVALQTMVERDRERLMAERNRLEQELEERNAAKHEGISWIIGESRAIREVTEKVQLVARCNLPVLLCGESGTGKELFARAIHEYSPRKEQPYIRLNCAALSESVLESELFGHDKGAFTGAIGMRKGRFEMADGGTLFLDEIGEISTTFQAKLLRVLQEGEFERVGGNHTIKVDVRLVTATNRNLEAAVISGDFRSDLYYRISVVPIFLPALRERREDIPLLAREFLKRFNKEHGVSLSISPRAMEALTACDFPGNVRELESCVRRTAALTKNPVLQAEDFELSNKSSSEAMGKSMSGRGATAQGARSFRLAESNGAERCAAGPGIAESGGGALRGGCRRRRLQRAGAAGGCHGAGRMGAGQGGPAAQPDAAADGLRAAQAGHRDQAVLSVLRVGNDLGEGPHNSSRFPRRLKPHRKLVAYGGTKVPPFQNGGFFRDSLAEPVRIACRTVEARGGLEGFELAAQRGLARAGQERGHLGFGQRLEGADRGEGLVQDLHGVHAEDDDGDRLREREMQRLDGAHRVALQDAGRSWSSWPARLCPARWATGMTCLSNERKCASITLTGICTVSKWKLCCFAISNMRRWMAGSLWPVKPM